MDTVTPSSRSQDWSLDALGNWKSLTTDGTAQSRTHNSQNLITAIATQTTPTYDHDGNTTKDNTGQLYVYDAWNHLIYDGNSTAYTYAYDAVGRRIHRPDGQEEELYYSAFWQVLETRVTASTTTGIEQYVWNPGYVDCLILRDRDTGLDGVMDERLYALQDANYNTTSLMDTTGAIQERYQYDLYGSPTFLDASFAARAGNVSSYDWVYLHQGGRYDITFGNLYYFRYRDLSPALGKWMQEDPRHFIDGMNFYALAGSNPVLWLDPFGLDWIDQKGRYHYGAPPIPGMPDPRNPHPDSPAVGDLLPPWLIQIPGYIWNSPNTAVGFLWGNINWIFGGNAPYFGNNAIIFTGGPFMSGGAITLGNVTVYEGNMDPGSPEHDNNANQNVTGPDGNPVPVGDHEEQHTYQGEILGPLYLPANLLGGILGLLTSPPGTRDPWHGPCNFMETGPSQPVPHP